MRLLRFARNDENSRIPYYVILGLDPRISSNRRHCEGAKRPKQSHSKFSHFGNRRHYGNRRHCEALKKEGAISFKIPSKIAVIAEIPSLRGFEKAEAISRNSRFYLKFSIEILGSSPRMTYSKEF